MTDKSRSRGYCYTINNYTDLDINIVDAFEQIALYGIYGKEVGANGTPHLQGFVYFKDAKTFKTMKKILPTAHIEAMKGTPQQAADYCKKDNSYKEFGTVPAQGKRNDVKIVKDKIDEGGSMDDIIEMASNYQTLRMAELLFKYKGKKRNYKPEVTWIYGESGTGKTKLAYEMLPNAYRKSNSTGKWWDGYDGHLEVIIDDVKDDTQQYYSTLLEITDRYPCRVELKGNTREFLANKIVITSIYSPAYLYRNHFEAKEILRRIDKIIDLGEKIFPEEPQEQI